MKKKRYLIATFDVTGLTAQQVDALLLEIVVQGEASEHHPDVPVTVSHDERVTSAEEHLKTVTLPQFLTEEQIAEAVRLYEAHGTGAVPKILARVIEPNMDAINAKLGQENDARYLAYAVVHVLTRAANPT
jgi:hypothetical protein